MEEVSEIEKSLDLEIIDPTLYRSKQLWRPFGNRGGQVIGLALNAATRTVDKSFHVHSLHSYFLLAGDCGIPIVYRVEHLRTGNTYATREVTASQKGRNIFSMMVSFAVPEISELSYQKEMPEVPGPDSLKSELEFLREYLDNPEAAVFHKSIQNRLQQPIVIDRKPVPGKYAKNGKGAQMLWLKAHGKLPDDPAVHRCVAAYCSDFEMLNSALIPFNLAQVSVRRVQNVQMMASLDHSIWFHHESFRADEWCLYDMEATTTKHGRGYTTGKIWSQDGRLLMSTAQEGVIRATLDSNVDIASRLAKL